QALRQRVELCVGAGNPVGAALRMREGTGRARCIGEVRRQRLGSSAGGGAERIERIEPPALREQRLLLGGARIELVDLLDLEREQVAVALQCSNPGPERFELAAERTGLAVAGRVTRTQREVLGAAEGIEEI